MALRIQTFDNIRGGNTLYKALTHPHAAAPGHALVAALAARPPPVIVDPLGAAEGFAEIFGLGGVELAGIYVQNIAQLGKEVLGFRTLPIDELADSGARSVLVAAFDAERLIGQLQSYLPAGAEVLSLDRMRIPEERLTNRRAYLDPLNFATNFALFRDTGALHSRVVTVNYWAGYGAAEIACWLTLFNGNGEIIAEWCERAGDAVAALTIDSREVRARFKLGDFAGQLFIHVAGAAGHDVVKYALDTFGESGLVADGALSCTHDADAWPSDRSAGLARGMCCPRRSCRAANGRASPCRRRWRCRRPSCRLPRLSTIPAGAKWCATPLAACPAIMQRRCPSTRSRKRSAMVMDMSSWSMISLPAATGTVGCTRCSAIATA